MSDLSSSVRAKALPQNVEAPAGLKRPSPQGFYALSEGFSPSETQHLLKTFRPTTALAKAVKFKDEMLEVHLTSGRIVSVPVMWFPLLHEASAEQCEHYEIGGGISLHWPEIDEDISVAGLLAGADEQAS